jgi:NO-binding membrane sensor protein with MHYT domain
MNGKHDNLLDEGPREAPEPETAEERSHRLGMKTAGGVVVGGGIAAAKFGGLAKIFLWLFAWNGVRDAWRLGGWIAIAVIAAAVAVFLLVRSRRTRA